MSLSYYKYYIDDSSGYVYSVDMLRIHFRFRYDSDSDDYYSVYMLKYLNSFYLSDSVDIKHFDNFAAYNYRHMFKITFKNFSVMTVGLLLNADKKDDTLHGFLEFNPNKVAPDGQNNMFWEMIDRFRYYIKDSFVARYDLAVDMPAPRCNFKMHKCGNSKYSYYNYGSVTEYSGVHNHHNFCKLYDKTIESHLDEDLTRFEITIVPGKKIVFPQITDIVNRQIDLESYVKYCALSSTQKVLVDLLRAVDNPDFYFRRLNSSAKSKLRPFLGTNYVEFNKMLISMLFQDIIVDFCCRLNYNNN